MTSLVRNGLLALAVLVSTAVSTPSWAQARAKLEVLVASATTEGTQVDKPLAPMAAAFKRNGLAFTSYRLVTSTRLDIAQGQSSTVKLPNGQATVTFVRQEPDGKYDLKVTAPGSSSEYSMAAGGEVYIDAGASGKGKLFLLLRR